MNDQILELASFFEGFVGQVPSNTEGEFIFSSRSLPQAPLHLKTGKLIIKKSHHYYDDSYRADMLQAYMSKETCRCLGVLFLSVLFHPEPAETWLELSHPESEIKSLVVEFPYLSEEELSAGYHSRPFVLSHFPAEPEQMFRCLCDVPERDKIELRLTNAEDCLGQGEDEWVKRDVVKGVGNDRATAFLAEFFLNVGRPEGVVSDYELTSYCNVLASHSAELRLWLPGTSGWCHHFCEDLE